ncbi:MAG: choice-of-anchor Q domain-containing protein [Gaiellaceae bacterium]
MRLDHRAAPRNLIRAAAVCVVAAAVLVSTQAGVERGVAAGVRGGSRYRVVVSTTADRVNGHVSSISALKTKPGQDGISLREALSAADKTGGSATVYIMFSARLNGKTIEVRSELPSIRRSHLVLEGIAPNGAPARVRLDARHAKKGALGELLLVQASNVTIRWLRFTDLDPRRNHNTQVAAVQVGQGRIAHAFKPKSVANVQIVDDVFDNSGFDFRYTGSGGGNTGMLADGLMVGTWGTPAGANMHISGVTIARNTFRYFNNDACGVLEASSGDAGRSVVILDNTFEGNEIPIELGIGGNAPRLTGSKIIGNTITPRDPHDTSGFGGSGISIDSNARNGTIDQTLIEDNAISGPSGLLLIQAEAAIPGLVGPKPGGDVISNTQIINNVLNPTATPAGGIALIGGNTTTSPPSRVSGVTIENDTIVNNQGNDGLFGSIPNEPGAHGNQITDVTVRNSILYEPVGIPISVTPGFSLAPDVLTNSLISGPGWAGQNGNINGDPRFVNAANGDFHLSATSPAVNAGTTVGAPSYDLDGAPRGAQPDIGAFEFGAVPRPALAVIAEQLGGSGTVTSSPAGINCGTVCSARFDPGSTVTLTARAGRGSRFLRWSNGCAGKARCTITLNSAQSVTARFSP